MTDLLYTDAYEKGMSPNDCTFPITQEQLDNMLPCDLTNPMVGESYGLKIPDSFNLVESSLEILKVRQQVGNKEFPWWFMEKYWPYNFDMPRHLPKSFEINGLSFSNPAGLADIVHMDDPMLLPLSQKKILTNPRYGGNVNIKTWHNKYKQFIETVADLNKEIANFQAKFIRKIFKAKSYFGIARPEEVLRDILTPNELTAYFNGCPTHASTPQGHLGFVQSATRAFDKHLALEETTLKNLLYEDYLWGQARCLAGVHHGIDAIMSILVVGGYGKYIKNSVKNDFIQN